MTFTIALNFEDGITRFIQCHAGEKVLDAAYRQKVNLPMDCSDGVCGTCKCHCASGEYALGDEYLDEALSDEDALRLSIRQTMTIARGCAIEFKPRCTPDMQGDFIRAQAYVDIIRACCEG